MSTIAEPLAAALADRYKIERGLGAGGMATVYLAEDLKHKRKVALKVLKPELAAVLGAERFIQEITTTAALQHPHILPLFDSGTTASHPDASGASGGPAFLYYVMPFIDGETLRAKLDRETQLGVEEAVKIATDVADALQYAHEHGVIHRDIKPENILLANGRPMVADFGIALAVSAAAGGRMTETGLSLGTPHYMSPEQATAEKDISARSDVYSLAAVLYEMLTGDPPHTGSSAQQVIMKIITELAEPVTKHRKSVPPHVASVLAKALEKLPADRFESASAFAAALHNPSFVASARAGLARPDTVRRLRPPLVVAGVVLTIAAGWFALKLSSRPTPEASWRVQIMVPDSTPVSTGLALSRDGSVLVYDGGDRLWLRTASATQAVAITGSEGGGYPALSPSGRQIAFIRSPNGTASSDLVVMSVDGGTPRRLVSGIQVVSAPAWSDHESIVYPDLNGLMSVPVAGGDGQRLTTIDTASGELIHGDPVALPGENGVVFTIAMRRSDSSYIAVVGPRGGTVTRLLPGLRATYARPNHLIVTLANGSLVAVPFNARTHAVTGTPVTIASGLPTGVNSMAGRTVASEKGRLIYVAAGRGNLDDVAEMIWMTRSGVAASIDTSWTGLFVTAAVSRDGRRAAVAAATLNGLDLLVRDLANGSVARISTPGVLLADAVFAPDGQSLYFVGIGATTGVFRVDPAAVTTPVRIIPSGFVFVRNTAIAPDGDNLYFVKGPPEQGHIVRQRLSDPKSDTAVVPTGGSAARPAVSPDGRWLAFLSTASGQTELRVRSTDLARSEDWRITASVSQGSSVHWSRAGDELFFLGGDSMKVVKVATGPSLTFGTPRALFPTAGLRDAFDIGADGRFLMIRAIRGRRTPTQLVMLERWTDLLRPDGKR